MLSNSSTEVGGGGSELAVVPLDIRAERHAARLAGLSSAGVWRPVPRRAGCNTYGQPSVAVSANERCSFLFFFFFFLKKKVGS